MRPLPRLMVAPNGARRTKADHPALPITDDELVAVTRDCIAAGADGAHLHLRDANGVHLLDAPRYRALLDRLEAEFPDAYLQVTSEAAGRYDAQAQRAMVRQLKPRYVSVALREMVRQPEDWPAAREFYHWAADAGVEIQHILYSPQEVQGFVIALNSGRIPGRHHLVQLVRGTYADGADGALPLADYLAEMTRASDHSFDWMLCSFGADETASLVEAARAGGKARVGFENSLQNADGSRAADNAERVREVNAALPQPASALS
ncbi:3-keto-5-aminohexanoate cleavage protein [Citreicella sp. C3M06]|uniref:3-keto-5-aminohexanoate cleavage protein n=1 Tax=Citreicella sp. C3M06 TaxID=2841564 RepID=UPI001C0862E4|nr:3-keto-5-aminohexanoate cleavage protein [Citreicella sp. C3M06]MBU2959279.1 3-keto-5-aminohexanoate cleavage protein [Citreicella sp. C3M06]